MHARWSVPTKSIISLLLLALGVYLLNRFGIVLKPLILAAILAYILSPLVRFFQGRLRIRRALAALLAYLVLLVVLITLPMVILPALVDQAADLNLDIQNILKEAETLLAGPVQIAGQAIDLQRIFQQAVGSLQGLVQPVFGQTLALVVDMITSLVWTIFLLIVSFYLIKDGPALQVWLEGLIPPGYQEDFAHLRSEISQIWSAFFRGQIVLASVVAVLFTIIGFLLGLPFALSMGLLAGLLEFLPSIGHGIWLFIASILAYFLGSTWLQIPHWAFMLIIIGLHLVYQQFDLNYLIPRIIGRRVHLHPLVVILGIATGALLAGVLGILLAAPTIASGRVLARYVYANLLDMEPFPESVASPLPPPNPHWWRKNAIPESGDLPQKT